MKEIKFTANDIVVKNNKSLKNRGQVGIELELEREQFSIVAQLEEYEPGTHFIVTMIPYDEWQKEVMKNTDL